MALGTSLTAAQANSFRAALDLLRGGRHPQALAIAEALAKEAPTAADAYQLMGMCLADVGDATGAEQAFRRALELAPHSPVVALNFAAWLRKAGRFTEAVQVLDAAPETVQTKLRQGMIALQVSDPSMARAAFERATRLQPDSVQAWHGLGNALRGLDELQSAEAAFRKAIALQPAYTPAWVNLGAVLRLLGHIDDALACFRYAEGLGHVGPELQDAINGVLADSGRPAEALAGARKLVDAHPKFAQAHDTLARMLWEYGPEHAPREDPLDAFRKAVQEQPGNRDLQLRFLQMLLAMRNAEEVRSRLQFLRRQSPDDPMLDWFAAEASDMLGRHDEAATLFEGAERRLGNDPDFLNARTRHSFRTGRFDQAAECASRVVKLDPFNQEAWSHLGTAWRLAGDPRESWLFDYDNLIGYIEVQPPTGFRDMGVFLGALKQTLDGLHLAGREPVNQSVRNGSQTTGRLFGRDDGIIRAAESALRSSVEAWMSTLPDDAGHPFLSRKSRHLRFVGSWSVRLQSSGRHSNHIHHEGWMSSAFYVSLPQTVREGPEDAQEGWIQFGQPLEELGLDLPPRRVIRPQPGYLALFPSYMWHGTRPFSAPEPRLTIAFDMKPG